MDANKIIYKYFFNDKTKSLYTGLLEKDTDTISVKKFIDCDQSKFRQFFKDETPLLQFLHDKFVDHDYVRETLEWASSESCCTVVTDSYLSELFRDIRKDVDPCRIKHPVNKDLVTEREFVLRYIGDIRLREIKNKLMSKYCTVDVDCIIPKTKSNVFLYFESKLDYAKERGESVLREKRQNRKFFYHIMTTLCPLLTVCKVDNGPDIRYDVLQQFYSIGDPCSDTQALFKNDLISNVSTPFEVLCRTSKKDKEELKVKVWSYAGKSAAVFRTPATNVMLNKIGVKSSFPRSLKNKWGIPIRRKYDRHQERQVPLVVLKCESGYAILDETICKVLYKCSTLVRLTAICTRLAPYVQIRYVGERQKIYEKLKLKPHQGMTLAVLNILTYVADNWSEERKTMFNNQALVTLLNKKNSCFNRVTAYDFSKFYPTIVSEFKVDQFLSDLLKMMIAFQYVSPLVKVDLVSLIGKSVFFDKFLFHSTKALGVAIMYDVIDSNPNLDIIGCSTDGYFVRENKKVLSDFPKINKATTLGIELPIKRENEFSKLIFLGSVTKYMGLDLKTETPIVKGYSNLRNKTNAEVKLVETIATHAINTKSCTTPVQFINSFKQSFESDTSSLTNFIVRDFVYRTPPKESNVKWKTHPEVYYQNVLMQDIDLVYYDKQTLKNALGGGLEPPLGQHTPDDNCCTCRYCMSIRSADRLGDKIHVSVCHKINVEMYKHNFFQLSSRMLNDIIQYMVSKEESEEEEEEEQDDTISLYVSVQTKINDMIDNVLAINGMACVGGLLEKA